MKELVAKLEVVGMRADGQRVAFAAEIGRPRRQRDGHWACALAVGVLDYKDEVQGVDSFHSVWLACALVLRLLENLKAEGWTLQNRDGSEFPLDAYRAGLGKAP